MFTVRTDLAFESRDFLLKQKKASEIDGIVTETENSDFCVITRVKIETDNAARQIKKPVGNYITLHSPHISSGLFTKELAIALAEEIKKLPQIKKSSSILVAGLGNDRVTPDSVGPRVVAELIVTRHIISSEEKDFPLLFPVSALAPGVLGLTGIETAEIFSSVTEKVKPDLIIAVDALAAGGADRLGTTVQLCDTGINPGSGVNNRRNALNKETLGVPVIVIGLPTVCDLSSVLKSSLDSYPRLSDSDKDKALSSERKNLGEAMMITPKNIDAIVERASCIISRGLNMALQPGLSYDEIVDYVS